MSKFIEELSKEAHESLSKLDLPLEVVYYDVAVDLTVSAFYGDDFEDLLYVLCKIEESSFNSGESGFEGRRVAVSDGFGRNVTKEVLEILTGEH